MQRKSPTRAALFACLVWASATAGCKPTPPSADAPVFPYQGQLVRVACPDDLAAELVRTHARAWAARAGAQVEVLRYDPDAGPAQAAGADAWVIAPAELPHWAAAGRLAPLPEEYTGRESPYGWMGLLPLYREHLLTWDRTAYGLPLLGESPLCCYRADLLADPAHQRAFREKYGHELRPPQTWEQFADLAEYFRGAGVSGTPGPSLPPLPADDALNREFYAVASCFARRALRPDEEHGADHLNEVFSFHYDLESGRPRLDAPAFVYALELCRRLQACRPDRPHPRPPEAFRDGRAVLCLTDASWLPVFQRQPALRDRFGISPLPGAGRTFAYRTGQEQPAPNGNRVPYLGGAGRLAVVPRDAAHAEAAFALLAELTGPEVSGQVALDPRWEGGPVRDEQLNRNRWDAFDLDASRAAALKQALQETLLHRNVKNPVFCLRIPDAAPHESVLAAHLRTALEKPAGSAPEALRAAARRWAEMDQAKGLDLHRSQYRISLGLRPL